MSMLIVIDERFQAQVDQLAEQIDNVTDITCVNSFQAANLFCQQNHPKLILAQTQLSDGNAFDFCTRIRLLQDEKLTPFIMFAEQSDKKEKVKTFQVGADEYITEFDIELLKAIVCHELEAKQQLDQLAQEKEQASNLIMESMKSSSELGNAINFIERCHRFQSNADIAAEIISFGRTMELNFVVAILVEQKWQFFATSKNTTELERDLMQSVHGHDRIVDFGVRTQFNWPNIALLCKNMPLREPEKYGRIKDLLPSLLSSANVRIHTLFEETRIHEQTQLMSRSIETLQPSIKEVIDAMMADGAQHRAELSDFLQKIIIALPTLGLEDDQEEFFISSVEALIHNADNVAKRNEQHCQTLATTNQVLLNLLVKQNEIQELINKPVEIAESIQQSDDDDLFELF